MTVAMIPIFVLGLTSVVEAEAATQGSESVKQESLEDLPLQPVEEKTPKGETLESKSPIQQRIADNLMQPEMLRKVGSSLALVIGVFLIFTILGRLASPRKGGSPADLVSVLGKVAISSKHQLHIVQFHQKILLLGETQNGLECFERIDDPSLVNKIHADQSMNFETLKSTEADRLLSMIKEQRSRLENDDDKAHVTRKSYVA